MADSMLFPKQLKFVCLRQHRMISALYWVPAMAYAALIFVLSHQSHPPGAEFLPDYAAHFFEYGFFVVTLTLGVNSGFRKQLRLKETALVWILAVAYALLDEFHQSFIPHRHASLRDFSVDLLGVSVFSVLLFLLISKRSGMGRV